MVRTKTNPTTSNDAAPAANSLAAPAPEAPKPVRLRVRGPTSTTTIDLQTTTPLKDLVTAMEPITLSQANATLRESVEALRAEAARRSAASRTVCGARRSGSLGRPQIA